MKPIKLYFLLLLISWGADQLYAQNLVVTNPGFELGDGTSWDFLQLGGSVANFSVTDQNPKEGNYCLAVNVTTLGSSSWSIQMKKNGWAVTQEKTYEISIWAKSATAGSKINFTIGKYTAEYDEYASTYGISLTQAWKKYTITIESPVTTADDITLALHSLDTYWFDDFQVIELTKEVTGATIPAGGKTVEVTFQNNLLDPADELQLPFFVSNANNEQKGVSNVKLSGTPTVLLLTLIEPVYKSEVITLEYIPGTLSTELGAEISAFSIAVENNSTLVQPLSNKVLTNELSVYPNPAHDFLMLEMDGSGVDYSYQIFDLSGKLTQSGVIYLDGISKLDISFLDKGFYILRISKDMTRVVNYKFLKD